MSETGGFKEHFGAELVADLARRITDVHPGFPAQSFAQQATPRLAPLELKGRVAAISAALREHLPGDYPSALAILLATLGPPLVEQEGMFKDSWWLMPIAHFVEQYGLEHPAESLAAIHAITQRHTGEFAIRPLLQRYPAQTLAALAGWARDPSFHVRRLVSEGTRPRLPWAARLPQFIADPAPVLALLGQLRDDPSAYVRRSVANNLNDISKDHPDLVLDTLRGWAASPSPARAEITRHALRGLVKQGHPAALALLGAGAAAVRLEGLSVAPAAPRIGEQIRLEATLVSESAEPQHLVVDYVLEFAGARGARRKVFKLRRLDLGAGERARLSWGHSLQQRTIRRHYPGAHRVEVQVNGAILGGVGFTLLEAQSARAR